MPKVSARGRDRRTRERAAEAGARRATLRPQKPGYVAGYRKWLVVRAFGFVLIGVAVVMAVVHIGAHLGKFSLLPTTGLQDLLIGWPMAGVLFLIGAVFAGRRFGA
ncbi:hypothetical protein [Amycolatopsis saalfeldensis]|uniref:Uncharacterized protein n=1 Tax=Amycolatopsis saalfeldensis TaxID=394193 RepID=A0A1H8YNC6_9PSEU|nr:hypothetical protein [Amycolatopsis saalfeldensis]SEP53542.1 hypothetical protein SAMN04489732_12829 [Amycolatopsis saalfeldensis]